MFKKQQKLDVTCDELDIIQSALHTQTKILNVQAAAGNSDAHLRLNAVKSALANVAHQTQSKTGCTPRRAFNWFGCARSAT